MNPYGERAKAYWQTYRPTALAAIPETDRDALFTRIGEAVETEIGETYMDLVPDPEPGEEVETSERAGQIGMAKLMAREAAMDQFVYLEKEPGTETKDMPATTPLPKITA
ncbi:hypothetical protein ACIQ9R_35845 [Streptomyces sp. NPDC094447]|uniref:hypothetical protein n=1 Tax=Streptomyces sp. NPDC094447 TaxID=3366062 RepID=UPI003827CA9E